MRLNMSVSLFVKQCMFVGYSSVSHFHGSSTHHT